MISVKVGKKKYDIATCYEDINAKQLHSIENEKPKSIIKALTSIDVDKIDSKSIIALYQILNFVESEPIMKRYKKDINVASESWLKLELTKQALATQNRFFYVVEVSRIYFGDEVFDWSLHVIYAQTTQILHSFNLFLERYKELNERDEYDDDQLEAGVKGLETFGAGAIRYSLAKGDVTKYEAIENMSAEAVYFTLLYERAVSMYQEKYDQIKSRQRNASQSVR